MATVGPLLLWTEKQACVKSKNSHAAAFYKRSDRMKHYRLRWESIAFPDMGLTEIVDAETAKDAKVKAEKNSTDEFLSVYYLEEIEEVPECVVNI